MYTVCFAGYVEPACSRALGMESGYIKDEQITASASLTGYEPHRARLNEESDGKL